MATGSDSDTPQACGDFVISWKGETIRLGPDERRRAYALNQVLTGAVTMTEVSPVLGLWELDSLRFAAERLDSAEEDRVVNVAAADQAGLSVRQIAAAVRLSPARVHQLLHAPVSAAAVAPRVALVPTWRDRFVL
jgi:hypothetical protein